MKAQGFNKQEIKELQKQNLQECESTRTLTPVGSAPGLMAHDTPTED